MRTANKPEPARDYNGFAIPVERHTELGLAILIVEDEEGNTHRHRRHQSAKRKTARRVISLPAVAACNATRTPASAHIPTSCGHEVLAATIVSRGRGTPARTLDQTPP